VRSLSKISLPLAPVLLAAIVVKGVVLSEHERPNPVRSAAAWLTSMLEAGPVRQVGLAYIASRGLRRQRLPYDNSRPGPSPDDGLPRVAAERVETGHALVADDWSAAPGSPAHLRRVYGMLAQHPDDALATVDGFVLRCVATGSVSQSDAIDLLAAPILESLKATRNDAAGFGYHGDAERSAVNALVYAARRMGPLARSKLVHDVRELARPLQDQLRRPMARHSDYARWSRSRTAIDVAAMICASLGDNEGIEFAAQVAEACWFGAPPVTAVELKHNVKAVLARAEDTNRAVRGE